MKLIETITDYKYKIFNSHWWKDLYYNQVRSRLFPRQRWLTKKIPRTWVDKDTLWEICILEGIKNFVEGEHALGENMCYFEESQRNPDYPPWQKTFDFELKEMYELITIKLPELEKQLETAWDAIPHFDFGQFTGRPDPGAYDRTYKDVNRLEKEICDLKTKVMVWAVTNRECVWT